MSNKSVRVEFIPKGNSIKRTGFLEGEYIYAEDVGSSEECRIYSKENVHILNMEKSVEKRQTCIVTDFDHLMDATNSYLEDGYTVDKVIPVKNGNEDYTLIIFNCPSN